MARRFLAAIARRPRLAAWTLLSPGLALLLAGFALPLLIMTAASLLHRGAYGGVEPGFTVEHYARFADPLYLAIVLRTAWAAAVTTALCLLLGYPVAFVIARSGRWKHVLLFLTVLPLWTSFLVRTYALVVLLRDAGVVNEVLLGLGIVHRPLTLLYTPGAVLLGLLSAHLPLMVLPVYASLERQDPALLEAAEVLGARGWARFVRVILPLSLPGVAAGCALVFVPALGAFLTPDLLGGARDLMIGNLIQNQFGAARNWPFGAAASFIVTTAVFAGMAGWRRLVRTES